MFFRQKMFTLFSHVRCSAYWRKPLSRPTMGFRRRMSSQRRCSGSTAVGDDAASRCRQTGSATRISRCVFDSAVSLGHEFRSVRKRDLTRPVCDVYTLVLHTDTRVVSLNNYFVRTIRRTHTHVYAMGTTADETDLFLRHLMWRFTH